ncbi:hypothetical protein FRC00_003552 [Tulasnella sp. 408]|nr:hypothetical protein FRC00_003552 [Tulasnella sp. 408]
MSFYSIWHSREYIYNRTNAELLRISNTYLYPAIKRTLASTDQHRQALVDSLIHFRYKAHSLSGSTAAQALMSAGREIRQWLRNILQVLWGCMRYDNAFEIIHIGETAQQPNGSDCGLYVHHHLRTFMAVSNPEKIISHYQIECEQPSSPGVTK